MGYIEELQAAILRLHNCSATYIETVPVVETFQGETIWEGDVEVFETNDHPKAQRIYAWGHVTGENDQARRYVAVLELPPVDSPQTAVRAGIMQELQNARKKGKASWTP